MRKTARDQTNKKNAQFSLFLFFLVRPSPLSPPRRTPPVAFTNHGFRTARLFHVSGPDQPPLGGARRGKAECGRTLIDTAFLRSFRFTLEKRRLFFCLRSPLATRNALGKKQKKVDNATPCSSSFVILRRFRTRIELDAYLEQVEMKRKMN